MKHNHFDISCVTVALTAQWPGQEPRVRTGPYPGVSMSQYRSFTAGRLGLQPGGSAVSAPITMAHRLPRSCNAVSLEALASDSMTWSGGLQHRISVLVVRVKAQCRNIGGQSRRVDAVWNGRRALISWRQRSATPHRTLCPGILLSYSLPHLQNVAYVTATVSNADLHRASISWVLRLLSHQSLQVPGAAA